jgi:hypothetical protein
LADPERLKFPPRAPIAFRVGVVGHRPNRLRLNRLKALREQIASILAAVKLAVDEFRAGDPDMEFYADAEPLLRVISPLAEGTDRIFADEGLKLGFSLCCPLPFAREVFEEDFQEGRALERNSLSAFHGLLDRAAATGGLITFELDGRRTSAEAEAAAYGAAGRVVMNQSDLMVVVWDGKESRGEGGTLDTLHEAVGYNVPVIWIDALEPSCWQVLRGPEDLSRLDWRGRFTPAPLGPGLSAAEEVAEIVLSELGLPRSRDALLHPLEPSRADHRDVHDEAVRHARAYFAERRWPITAAVVWKPFRDLLGMFRFRWPQLWNRDFVDQVRDEWPTSEAESRGRMVPRSQLDAVSAIFQVNRTLRAHFAWSDRLADLCADAHRSTFVLSYLLAALAVLFALLPGGVGWPGTPFVGLEFASLVVIFAFLAWGAARRWHERWLEYRLMAEFIRQLRFLVPLGGGRPLVRTPTYLTVYGDPARSWMYWHVRAIARGQGLPLARVDARYVSRCLEDLEAICDGQRSWHRINSLRSERIHHVLHYGSMALFLATIITTGSNLAAHVPGIDTFAGGFNRLLGPRVMILLAAVLPAFGAALAGINHSGEFLRSAKRSHAMADEFGQQAKRIRLLAAHDGEPTLAEAIPIASRMAQTMVEEVVDWRSLVLDRPPGPA